jgi:hypothetical protein
MRQILAVLAAVALGACETMPEFMQQPTTSSSAATTSYADTSTPAASSYAPPPDQQLLELERQLSASAQDYGLGGALASVIDPTDGMVIRPGVVYSSAEEISAGLTAPSGAGPMYWQPDRVHVSASGDMGMTSGRFVQVITGSEAVQGRFVVVWRRDSAGEWRALTETRIPDPPRSSRRR